MSKRDRFTALAAGLALIVAFSLGGYILGFGLGEQSGDKQATTYTYARHAQDEIDSTCAGLNGTAQTKCIVRVVEATNEHKRSQNDLNAQRNMAKWALLMLLATFAMAIITAFGVYYVWRTLKATQDMATETTRIGEAQTRAYITRTGGGVWEGIGLEFALNLKNTGNSPALNAYIIFEMEYWVECAEQEFKIFTVSHDGSRRPAQGPAMENRHFYTQPMALGDIGAGGEIDLDKSSFVGFDSEHHDPVKDITAANIGFFAKDVFGRDIFYFGGVGVFEDRGQYGDMKDITVKSAPHTTRGCEHRMKAIWAKKKPRKMEWDNYASALITHHRQSA